MVAFYRKNKTHNFNLKKCAGCNGKTFNLIVPTHLLGQFPYCYDCVLRKKCKCIICLSELSLLSNCLEYKRKAMKVIEHEEGAGVFGIRNVLIAFLERDLTTREKNILHELYCTEGKQIVLHNNFCSINAEDLTKLLEYDKNERRFTYHEDRLESKHIAYYIGLLQQECKELIFHTQEIIVFLKTTPVTPLNWKNK